jgi:hypothetical protein
MPTNSCFRFDSYPQVSLSLLEFESNWILDWGPRVFALMGTAGLWGTLAAALNDGLGPWASKAIPPFRLGTRRRQGCDPWRGCRRAVHTCDDGALELSPSIPLAAYISTYRPGAVCRRLLRRRRRRRVRDFQPTIVGVVQLSAPSLGG